MELQTNPCLESDCLRSTPKTCKVYREHLNALSRYTRHPCCEKTLFHKQHSQHLSLIYVGQFSFFLTGGQTQNFHRCWIKNPGRNQTKGAGLCLKAPGNFKSIKAFERRYRSFLCCFFCTSSQQMTDESLIISIVSTWSRLDSHLLAVTPPPPPFLLFLVLFFICLSDAFNSRLNCNADGCAIQSDLLIMQLPMDT